jgi:LmbE family N-acetylglucosaminyl deacetylase
MKTIIIAPHPDDETIGAGGTLLRRKAEGGSIAWVIVTSLTPGQYWSKQQVVKRSEEIKKVAEFYEFDSVFELKFPSTRLDEVAMGDLISAFSEVFNSFLPEEVFVPNRSDVHTDHRVVFDAAVSCTKWFRYPSVSRVLSYETLSETDFGLNRSHQFNPNLFVNISSYIEDKCLAMRFFESEIGEFPFPRSCEAIRALATLRGAASGYTAAEAFEILRERV